MAGDISFISQLPIWFMQIGGFNAFDVNYALGQIGAFTYILPFFLIFSVIFGILTSTNIIGSNRGVNLVIAFSISLMALQIGIVQSFFIELFPRLAIGLFIILSFIILIGLFIPHGTPGKGWFIGFAVAGVIVAIIVITSTFDQLYWFDSYFWQNAWPTIIGAIIFIVLLIFVAVGAKPKTERNEAEFLFKPFRD